MKVHLDTDLGGDIDDLCALAMLLRLPDVDLVGITTVAEHAGRRAGYTRYVLQLAGRDDIPVAAGADASLGVYREWPGLPEESRYWPEPVRPQPGPPAEALRLLEHSLEQGAVVIAIGPFTNLRLLGESRPGLLREARVWMMGGYVYPPRPGFPQWGNEIDYNMQVDVQSARFVLDNAEPTLVPLSMTVETALRRAYLERLSQAGPVARLIALQAEVFARDENNETRYGQTCSGLPADIINFQHDPLAAAIATGWRQGVEIETVPLKWEVRDGWLHEWAERGGRPTPVVTRIDGAAFGEFWLDVVG